MVQVDVVRITDCDDLIAALVERGFDVRKRDDENGDISCGLEVEGTAGDVEAAIESWLAENDLPLVPMRTGESSYLVRPPGD